MSEWFDTFFDALAHDVWDALIPPEASDAEAAWLARRLELRDGVTARLLDVPSGRGRLARRLADRGQEVTAVDFAPAAVVPLRDAALPGITAVVGDMRNLPSVLPPDARFDGAYCMGNSFGYLDPADTARFLAGVAAVLVDGGRFVVDAATAAESLLPHLELGGDDDRHAVGDVALTNRHHYDVETSILVTDMVLEHGAERAERRVGHRVMTCREIVAALGVSGFAVVHIDGDTDSTEFAVGAPRCLITAIRAPRKSTG